MGSGTFSQEERCSLTQRVRNTKKSTASYSTVLMFEDPHERSLPASADVGSGTPMYQGLYVFPLEQNGVERHIIARMRSVHEGGMREFIDPVSGETVGSCGSGFAAKK